MAGADNLEEGIRAAHSCNDCQLLLNRYGTSFAGQLGEIFRYISKFSGRESPPIFPKELPTFMNMQYKHTKIVRVEHITTSALS